jgi:ATP-binding cassette subfamily C exporter for protease/lipase
MIAANVLTSRALAPIDGLVGSWKSLLSAKDAYLRLDSTLSESAPVVAVLPKENWQADVLVKHASIKVDGRDLPILQDVQFHAPLGSTTVVMGPSGSGKSTLSRVLLGIQAVTDGVVLFDGVDIGHWPKSLLGPHLGYLPQTVDLLEGTVAANIARFGEIDSVKVVEAAKATGLHELILRLPHGYETDVGESGRFLSGGFRQRIALCRAIYGSPKLVVLDEPNANLDDAGEKALVQVLTHLKQQACTVVLVTHRSQYLALADRVLVLDRGVVQASGPKDGVLAALSQRKN